MIETTADLVAALSRLNTQAMREGWTPMQLRQEVENVCRSVPAHARPSARPDPYARLAAERGLQQAYKGPVAPQKRQGTTNHPTKLRGSF